MIAIIDYGMANLRSVQKGFERVGFSAEITSDPGRIVRAPKVVLPGVGAFADGMRGLAERGLIEPVKEVAESGKPFLGICLGMQMLFTTSYEDGEHAGLGILGGKVVRFSAASGLKVPHMGWNELRIRRPAPVLAELSDGSYVYFVHSYYVVPDDPTLTAAEADYPTPFTAVVGRDNLFGCQFHPEKSQQAGLSILRNFAQL